MSARHARWQLSALVLAAGLALPTLAEAATILYAGPGVTIHLGVPYGPMETPGPTLLGHAVLEHRDADYLGPGSYLDWIATVDADGDIDGYGNEVWLRDQTDTLQTTTTVLSSIVSVQLHGDSNDGIADIFVDGLLVATLDMFSSPAENACIIVTGLPLATHVIDVVDNDPAGADVAIMGGCALGQAELIANGDFEGGFTTGTGATADSDIPNSWTVHETRDYEISTITDALDNGPSLPGEHSVNFYRDGGVSGDWTTIEQLIGVDVSTATQLTLSLDVKVLSHSLEAGGWCPATDDWEWPVTVRVSYHDAAGSAQTFVHGFYIDPPGTGGCPAPNETLVPQGVWTTAVFDLLVEAPGIAIVDKIRVGGAGWSFEGRVDNVSLTTAGGPPPSPNFKRGDVNEDGGFDIADAVAGLSALFVPGTPTPNCLEACDANDDGIFDIADPVRILDALFASGIPLVSPGMTCGPDPTADALGCASYAPCP